MTDPRDAPPQSTPRTDAALEPLLYDMQTGRSTQIVKADFARQLELELNALRAAPPTAAAPVSTSAPRDLGTIEFNDGMDDDPVSEIAARPSESDDRFLVVHPDEQREVREALTGSKEKVNTGNNFCRTCGCHFPPDDEDRACRAWEKCQEAQAPVSAIAAPMGHDEAHARINECFREIEIICDSFGYDPAQWLVIDDDDLAPIASTAKKEGKDG